MNKFKNYILMAAGFAVLVGMVAGITAGPAIAQVIKSALVKNIDEPGRAPYSSFATCIGANTCTMSFPMVPANKRLVVQFLSASLNNPNPVSNDVFLFLTSVGKNYARLVAVGIDGENWAASQPMTAYIDAGAIPQLNAVLTGAIGLSASGILTGYLVDLTQ
jgi:hypothetical protein